MRSGEPLSLRQLRSKVQNSEIHATKECATCPLRYYSLCQKTFKIRESTDIQKYTYSARGSRDWDELYNERTAVERVNAYLKEFFGLNNVRHRTGKKANLHFQLVTLVYNTSRLATDRIRKIKAEQMSNASYIKHLYLKKSSKTPRDYSALFVKRNL
ncbi:transposase [Siminovitchia terrae]|uniref:transposase n=1 Tax=Siminovitchia terrae TaxID=1914933 RepID=UPI001BB3B9D3